MWECKKLQHTSSLTAWKSYLIIIYNIYLKKTYIVYNRIVSGVDKFTVAFIGGSGEQIGGTRVQGSIARWLEAAAARETSVRVGCRNGVQHPTGFK